MEKFVVTGHHHSHPSKKFSLKLPKMKHYEHVAVKNGEKDIDTKKVIEQAVFRSSLSLQHQVQHNSPSWINPGQFREYLPRSLQSLFLKQPFPLNQGPVVLPFECKGRLWEDGGVKVNARSAEEVLNQRIVFHHGSDQPCGDWHPVLTGISAWKNSCDFFQNRSYEICAQSIKIQGACSLQDMSIVYPCNHLCCSVRCPCSVCINDRVDCKMECKDEVCLECNPQCKEHRIKLPRVFDAEHDHCMIVTQKIDEYQIGVPFAGIPLSCSTCTNDIQEHQALHLVFHTRCKYCQHQMKPMVNALSREVMNGADFQKAIELVRWSDSITCSVCLSQHKDSFTRKKHEKQIHFKLEREFKCALCDKNFTNKNAMEYHLNKHKSEPNKITCDLCGSQFFAQNHLNEHKVLVHDQSEGRKKFKCSYCDTSFVLKKSLNRHLREKHMESNKNTDYTDDVSSTNEIKCGCCEKSFKRVGDMKRHMKTVHSDEKLFKCVLCDKEFSRKDILLRHSKIVHNTANS